MWDVGCGMWDVVAVRKDCWMFPISPPIKAKTLTIKANRVLSSFHQGKTPCNRASSRHIKASVKKSKRPSPPPHSSPATTRRPPFGVRGHVRAFNWETCLPVPKRRHAAALHITHAAPLPKTEFRFFDCTSAGPDYDESAQPVKAKNLNAVRPSRSDE